MSVNCSHKQQLAVTARVSLLKVRGGSCLGSPLSQPLLSESSFFQGDMIAHEDVVSLLIIQHQSLFTQVGQIVTAKQNEHL